MWGTWATRYCLHMHVRNPVGTLMAYLLIGAVSWVGMIAQSAKPKPKFITNPQTAQEFTQRCQAHTQDRSWQQALKDCNKAISLNASLPEAYFGRSAARYRLKDEEGAQADLSKGQRLIVEQNKKLSAQILRSRRNP